MFFLDFLTYFSLIFEFLALFLAFYFKNTRIFFITLALLVLHLPYFFSSVFQAHLFVSLFLPLIFILLCVKKISNNILEKANISSFAIIIFIGILGFILPNNTNFNASSLDFHLNIPFFSPISDLAFLFFVIFGLVLIIQSFKRKEYFLLLAFISANFQFLFDFFCSVKYFEFASLFFCFLILHKSYKILFFDPLTKLPNEKKLIHYIKGKNHYIIALLHFSELEYTQESYTKLILKQIAKILKRFKAKIFIQNNDFVLIFNDNNEALRHLGFLESLLKNTEFKLENESFKPEFKIIWKKKEGNLTQDLESLRAKL
ncbi:hypothetical protein [Campylobacter estrildidarum]|uniref:GGDEF domain-containing protein n=1 Tax=Campylobacter estrildidarum TaxID=2510189 RepID=A0A4U7BFS5_9BACT|nr:hypothetical protein [Campylobacter estrildidarum]TKX28560.1 hypothetical protein CQA69_08140 [Campylobacter estrildidarum]